MDHESLIQQFADITGAPSRQARQYLESSQWNLDTAITTFYAAQDDGGDDPMDDSDYHDEDEVEKEPSVPVSSGGGRILGESSSDPRAGVPVPATSSATSQKPPQKKIATLGDFNSSAAEAPDSDDDERQDLFAGGEKSGLAVQNPDDLKKKILEKARSRQPPPKEEPPKKSHFTGSARTLGGEEEPSREIRAPTQRQQPQRVDRVLHFWQDGFSVGDGDLYRVDDPRNAEILDLIRQGRAPLHIMDVEAGQEVDVEIKQHNEKYVKPKPKYKPFGGQGQRLGSPTPGASSMPGSFTTNEPATASSASATAPTTSVDESQPTITLRISLASGTRLTSRFNTTQTIGDVYAFVSRAESGGRDFILQTTFPTKELDDKSKVLGDMAEFKRGGTVVQKIV